MRNLTKTEFQLLPVLIFFALIMGFQGECFCGQDVKAPVHVDKAWSEQVDGYDHIHYQRFSGEAWTHKVRVSEENMANLHPSVDSGTDGITWIVWTGVTGTGSSLFFSMFDGTDWSYPQEINTGFQSNTSPCVVVDGDNTPWIVWAGLNGVDDDIFLSKWNGYVWQTPEMVNLENDVPDIRPTISINADNHPTITWFSFEGDTYREYHSRWTGSTWEIDRPVDDESQPETGPDEVRSTTTPSNTAASATVIIGFGDSITKGTPYVTEKEGAGKRIGGYEPKLEALLKADKRTSYVYNWGVGGEDTSQGVIRIDDVLDSYSHVDYILIMEGTNDIGLFSSQTTISNIKTMLERSAERSVRPIIATLTPDTQNGTKTVIPNELNPGIKKLAEEKNILLSDHYAAMVKNWASLSADGLHPNDAGYQVMADTWFKTIQKIPTKAPSVMTLSASAVGDTSVTLNGTVNPNGNDTTYYFEYNTSASINSITVKYNAGGGNVDLSVSVDIASLTPDTTYAFRIVASNAKGTAYGRKLTFKTAQSGSSTPTPSSSPTNSSSSGCFISTSRL